MRYLIRIVFLALVALGTPAYVDAGPPPAAVTAPAPHAQPLTRTETRRYAQREQASPELKKFQGGQVVIAISTAGAILIAVILVLVLL